MLLFVKASTDGFLATIHHLRTENDGLKKENLALKFVNETLLEDVRMVKLQANPPFNALSFHLLVLLN